MKRKAFIFGSGAVENSWMPVQQSITPHHFLKPIGESAANLALASLVFHLRLNAREKKPEDEQYKNSLEILTNTKKAICEHIQYFQNQGILKVRQEFDNIVKKIILPYNALLFVTTNWDTAIEDYFKKNYMPPHISSEAISRFRLHLHGYSDSPDSLYLPTEIIEEDYRDELMRTNFAKSHISMVNDLKKAEIMIFYGISISALDIELYQFLSIVFTENKILEEIIIVDPNFKEIAEKLFMNENLRNTTFKGCCPTNLSLEKLF